jgi:hypothetical protein
MAKQYESARQLVELTCSNCHVKLLIDPQDQDSVATSKEWIMIVPSDGVKLAAHDKACAMKVVHKLPTDSLIVSTED